MDDAGLADGFAAHRPRLLAAATRTLGSRADAEDAVQEAWIRLDRQQERIEDLGGWLNRVVGRLCIDSLRRRTARLESPLDPGELDPVVTDAIEGPEDTVVRSDSVGIALAMVLETLRSDERLAFVLHDVFAVPFAQIAPILDRSTDATKMLASRARRKVREMPRATGTPPQRHAVVTAFLAAARDGDFETLLRLLDPEADWYDWTARGHEVHVGADEVLALLRRARPDRVDLRQISVDGEPGVLARGPSGRPLALMMCIVADGRLVRVVSVVGAAALARWSLPGG